MRAAETVLFHAFPGRRGPMRLSKCVTCYLLLRYSASSRIIWASTSSALIDHRLVREEILVGHAGEELGDGTCLLDREADPIRVQAAVNHVPSATTRLGESLDLDARASHFCSQIRIIQRITPNPYR